MDSSKSLKSKGKSTSQTPKSTKSAKTSKSSKSTLGAPSQHTQSSRKGKKAWRKNVDIGEVEEALEGMRAEERVVGSILQKTTNDELFQIDVQGDVQLKKTHRRFHASDLTAAKILTQRSAVPAVFSRPTPSNPNNKRSRPVSREDKDRLLRIAKRPRKGPFNTILDHTEPGAGSSAVGGLSEAVLNSGAYDPWNMVEEVEDTREGMETVQVKKFKAPQSKHYRHEINIPAITEPHQGISYNPPASAHTELLLKAHEIESKREVDAQKLAEIKAKFENAGNDNEAVVDTVGVPPGMKVDGGVDEKMEEGDEAEGKEDAEEVAPKKMAEKKTKQQRAKAAKVLAEKRALASRAANKRLLASINDAKLTSKQTDALLRARSAATDARRLLAQQKFKDGLAGQRLGRHKVPTGELDVQLGEDLSETLRALKPEGNLFRDRFLSLQQRALVEPRVPVLPKRRANRMVSYEKHAWKNFDT